MHKPVTYLKNKCIKFTLFSDTDIKSSHVSTQFPASLEKSESYYFCNTCFFIDDLSCYTYYDLMCITTPRCNQSNGKTHFTDKPGKNVVNTSKNGLSSNLFKITLWLCNTLKPNSKLEIEYFFTD